MTPVRSVAASVVALGFASTLAAPMPAFATPAPCQLVDHYAAQAGAQVLRINRLDLGPPARPSNRRGPADKPSGAADKPSGGGLAAKGSPGNEGGRSPGDGPPGHGSEQRKSGEPGDADLPRGLDDGSAPNGAGHHRKPPATPAEKDGNGTGGSGAGIFGTTLLSSYRESAPRSIGGVGLGDARSVLIADNPIRSGAAARLLDGRVAGSPATNDLVVQQAPPDNPRPTNRHTAEKRFGPLRAGAADLTAHARWNTGVGCAASEAATSSAEVSRITVTGAGNESLLRVPEKVSGLSSTALRNHDGRIESVASATMTADRISLADGEVRIRVLRAPALQVSMSAAGKHRVDYRPAVIEVFGKNIPTKRIETVRDHVDVTLSDEVHELEAQPALIEPIGPLPLPPIGELPATGEPETTPAPGRSGGTKLRISLGDVRQASKGKAVAARADAIRISLVRDREPVRDTRVKPGYGPSSLVADLSIGLLEGAAVAPQAGAGVSPGSAPGAGGGTGDAGLPITGPRAVSLALGGVALLLGGIGAVLLASRKRRLSP